jgi:membrane-associated phospholipid phosphatase
VNFPWHLIQKTETKESTRLVLKRMLWIFLVCCIQMIYIPTSNRVTGGLEPKLPIDVFPVWPIWVLPYILCYALWLSGIAWIIFKAEDRLFRSFLAACLLTFILGNITFIFFPTYVRLVTLEGHDVFTVLLRSLHENWGRYNALPSGHIYITTLLTLFFSRWYPHLKVTWVGLLVIVSLSTLFTGQHYLLDVLGGYLVAWAGYRFGLWWARFYARQKQNEKRSGKRAPSSSTS